MSISLPLDQMTTEEKLEASGGTLNRLTRNEKEFESPAWHAKVLHEREDRIEAGQERFIDSDMAKKQSLMKIEILDRAGGRRVSLL